MPIQFQCTSCSKILRVGDAAAGKKARCPECGTIQNVPLTSASPSPATEFPAPPFSETAPPVPPTAPQTGFFPRDSSSPSTSPPQGPSNPFAEQSSSTPAHGVDATNPYASPSPTPRAETVSRQDVLNRVAKPAWAMISLATLLLAGYAIGMTVVLIGALQDGLEFPLIVHMGRSAANVILQLIVLDGARHMLRLRHYRRAQAAAIICMIPICGCCVLGLPVGIWAILVLNNATVQREFS